MNDYRDSGQFKEYYQTQADIIGIFWQFHKERLREGKIEFCKMPDLIPRVKRYAFQDGKINPIGTFALTIEQSLSTSWKEFLLEVNSQKEKHEIEESKESSFPSKFVTSYAVGLVKRAEELNRSLGSDRFAFRVPTSTAIVEAGINQGSEAATQMAALFGIDFEPTIAVILSKVELNNLTCAREGIGLDSGNSTTYSLLDNSKLGLNRQRLKELGLGKTYGCPAGMKVSETTRKFLTDLGVPNVGETTMLEEFAAMTSREFDRHIGSWFRGLTPEGRQALIQPEALRVLDGTARSGTTEGNQTTGRCPYAGGRERMR